MKTWMKVVDGFYATYAVECWYNVFVEFEDYFEYRVKKRAPCKNRGRCAFVAHEKNYLKCL